MFSLSKNLFYNVKKFLIDNSRIPLDILCSYPKFYHKPTYLVLCVKGQEKLLYTLTLAPNFVFLRSLHEKSVLVKQLGARISCEDVHKTYFKKNHKPKYVQNLFKIKAAYAPPSQNTVSERNDKTSFWNVTLRYLKILEKICCM
jgi:hypothetical protein